MATAFDRNGAALVTQEPLAISIDERRIVTLEVGRIVIEMSEREFINMAAMAGAESAHSAVACPDCGFDTGVRPRRRTIVDDR
jgi:hypothetical protein